MIPVDDNKFICHNHFDIINDCHKIRECIKNGEKDLALQYIDHLHTCALRALNQGKRMEFRLVEYKKAIEALGFTRNKA